MKHYTRIVLILSAYAFTPHAAAMYGNLLQLAQSLKILAPYAPTTPGKLKTPPSPTSAVDYEAQVKALIATIQQKLDNFKPSNASEIQDDITKANGLIEEKITKKFVYKPQILSLQQQLTKKIAAAKPKTPTKPITPPQPVQPIHKTPPHALPKPGTADMTPQTQTLIDLTDKLLQPARGAITLPISLSNFKSETSSFITGKLTVALGHITVKGAKEADVLDIIKKIPNKTLSSTQYDTLTDLIIALLIVHPLGVPEALDYLKTINLPEKNQYHIIETIYNYALKCLEEGLARKVIAEKEHGFCKDFTVATQIPIVLKPTISLLEATQTPEAEACLAAISKLRDEFLTSELYKNFDIAASKCGIKITSQQYIKAITIQKRSYCVINPTIPSTGDQPTTEEYPYIPVVLDLQTIADAIAQYQKLGTPSAFDFNGQLERTMARNEIFTRLQTLAQFLRSNQGSQKPCVRCFAMEMGKIFAGDDVGPKYNRIHYHPAFDAQHGIIKHALYGGQQYPTPKPDTSCYIYMHDRSAYMKAVDNAVTNANTIDAFIAQEAKPTTAIDFQELQKAVTNIPVTDVVPGGHGDFTYKPIVMQNLIALVKYLQGKWMSFESNEKMRPKIQVKH